MADDNLTIPGPEPRADPSRPRRTPLVEPAIEELEGQIEWLIDTYGLSRVLTAVANVCADKAAADKRGLAKQWLAASTALERIKAPAEH